MPKPKKEYNVLPLETKIEIIEKSCNKTSKLIMTIAEWQKFKRNPANTYIPYQLGFSKFKINL